MRSSPASTPCRREEPFDPQKPEPGEPSLNYLATSLPTSGSYVRVRQDSPAAGQSVDLAFRWAQRPQATPSSEDADESGLSRGGYRCRLIQRATMSPDAVEAANAPRANSRDRRRDRPARTAGEHRRAGRREKFGQARSRRALGTPAREPDSHADVRVHDLLADGGFATASGSSKRGRAGSGWCQPGTLADAATQACANLTRISWSRSTIPKCSAKGSS